MKRAPELEALGQDDDAIVADSSVRKKQVLGGAILILLGLVAGYLVLADRGQPVRDVIDGEEEFSTTTFRPPSFAREGEAEPASPGQEVIELPPPPPPPTIEEDIDTTEFDVPPPPLPGSAPHSPDASEPVPEEFPARYRSNQVVVDNPASDGSGNLGGDGGDGLTVAGEDRNSKFLAAAASIADRNARARKIDRIDALVPEGTLIPGILETAIVSDLSGQIRAIVSEDVYSFDGRRVLVPTGTRLIGEYQSEITRGQRRIFVVWTRMLRDDGVSVRLDSIGSDSLGRAGLTGRVDNRFRERFGAAILLSVVGGGASYLSGHGSSSRTGNDDARRAEELARQTIAQTFSDMANQALGDSLRIPPTISVGQGERIFVFVRQDLDFSAMYEDPVVEALREIRRERNLD